MAATSRLQINFDRLLSVCENAVSDHDKLEHWRMIQYVEDLQNKLTMLQKETVNRVHAEMLKDYKARVELLKGIMSAEQMKNPLERMSAAQALTNPKPAAFHTSSNYSQTKPESPPTQTVLLHTKAKFSSESRRALLGDGLRQRGGKSSTDDADLDSIIHHHQQVQEKLADDMVHLARNMKEHAQAARTVVQDDNKKLEETNRLADSNYKNLKVESTRLEDQTKKSSWWIFTLIFFVISVFIMTILFMKLFPKPRS